MKTKKTKAPLLPGSEGPVRVHITLASMAPKLIFRVQPNRTVAFEPKIFPGYEAPIIHPAADGERELVTASWGFAFMATEPTEQW